MSSTYQRSFLKWAGNKYSLLPYILPELKAAHRLIEPFAGSGVVSLNSTFNKYILAETNQDLINVYNFLKKYKNNFILDCKKYFIPENNTADMYYKIRDEFNSVNDPYKRAKIFIYLNRHSFNGLCRYNSKLIFNAPFGRYKMPKLPEQQMQYFIARSKNMQFINADYRTTMLKAKPGDLIYCDPPYTPLSVTSNFTQYHGNIFSNTDHEDLVKLAKKLSNHGITVMISNHDLSYTRELYQGAKIRAFEANRWISCNANGRNKVKELLAIFSCPNIVQI